MQEAQNAGGSTLEVVDAGMTFGPTTVLEGVDLTLRPGEVHALAGHNGSGKSTLVKILSGHYVPHPETVVTVDGAELEFGHPESAIALGLRFVHQNLALVPDLTVVENLALGLGFGSRGVRRIRWSAERARARDQLAALGYAIDPTATIGELSASERSAVAIARALSDRAATPAQVLVLDEVTATMPLAEVERLLTLVEQLKQRGVGILMITHHLEELERVADRATVLRDGRAVATVDRDEMTVATLTSLIMGDAESSVVAPALNDLIEPPPSSVATDDDRGLVVCDLQGEQLDGISFTVRPGEIVGFSGVTGSGREELAGLLHGAVARGGTVEVDGKQIAPERPADALAAGLVLVPADRPRHAMLPGLTVRENVTISRLSDLRGLGGRIDLPAERSQVQDWIDTLGIKGATCEVEIGQLSGGNQQKVILARAIRLRPRVLVLDEPTQGVDVGAIADIYRLVRTIAQGTAIVLCSSDLGELAELCTTVHVVRRGRLAGRLDGTEVSEERIAHLELAVDEPRSGIASAENDGASE